MMMKNTCIVGMCLFLLSATWSCHNGALLYNPDQKRSIYFYKNAADYIMKVVPDTMTFSFAAYEENRTSYEYRVPIRCMGMPVDEDQAYELEIVSDSTTASVGTHFEWASLVIPKNEVEGVLSITLKRTGDMVDHPVILYLRFKENDYFKPMEDDYYRLSITDGVLAEPRWWHPVYLGVYKNDNHELYRKLLENYWALETLKPLFYAEKVEMYGRYLENAPVAFFQQPNNMIWINHVFKPAYDYYNDPANTYDGFAMVNPDQFIM